MKIVWLAIIPVVMLVAGCVSFKSKAEMEASSAVEPTASTMGKVDKLLHSAMIFQNASQSLALSKGRELTETEVAYAIELGVRHPEKVRIYQRWRFPKPQDKVLLAEFNKLGFGSWLEGGRSNGYGVFIKSYFPHKDATLRHELVHVMQAEKMGLWAFTRQYLVEAMTYSYFNMPLEMEAFEKAEGESY